MNSVDGAADGISSVAQQDLPSPHRAQSRTRRQSTTRLWHRNWRRHWLSLALAGLLGVLGAQVLIQPVPAAAEEPDSFVSVSIDKLEPALPTRDGTITLSGTITNTSDAPLTDLRVYLWRSTDPITDTEQMATVLDSEADAPIGRRIVNVATSRFPAEENIALDPEQTKPFTVSAPVSALTLPQVDGVYLAGVHVRGTRPTDQLPGTTVGRGRIFLPMVANPPTNALQMTSLVMLSSRPSMLTDGVFADDHLADDLAPGGRLGALLAAARQPAMTYAIDPALLLEVKAMRAGYLVRDDDGGTSTGKTTEGSGQQAATTWLASFAELRASGDGFRLLAGQPDLAALTHAGRTELIDSSAALSASVADTAELPLLVTPTVGLADEDTLAAAEALKPAAILLSDASTGQPGPRLTSPGGIPIVNFGSTTFGGGPGPDPRNTPAKLQQRVLADSWIEATTAPEGSTLGRLRVITTAAQAVGDSAEVATPWMQRTTLTRLLEHTPTAWDGALTYSDDQRAAELTGEQLDTMQELTTDLQTYVDLFVDPTRAKAQADLTLGRISSGWWRGAEDPFDTWTEIQSDDIEQIFDSLQLSITRRIVTTTSARNFPVTVRNELPAGDDPDANAVKVKVAFSSDNNQRLAVEPLLYERINASDANTLNGEVSARANGTVEVTATLTTENGTEIGKPVKLEVSATQAGATGWIITIAAGLVLIGSTAWRIRTVTREKAKAAALAAATETAGGSGTGPGLDEASTATLTSSARPTDDEARPNPQETLDV